jgi:hypothetical protein
MQNLYLWSRAAGVATLLAILAPAARAQTNSVGIGTTTPDAKAALDISATGKGLLIPRMDSATRAGIGTPPDGLMVFQTDGRKGFWYAMSGSWLYIPDKTKSGDNLGSHTATRNLNLQGNLLTGGGTAGVGVAPTGNATATVNAQPLLRLIRPTTSFVKWPNELQIALGSYGTSTISQSRADFNLIDGASSTVDRTVLSLLANGRVGIGTTDPQQALDVAGTARAQRYAYAAPQTRVLAVSHAAFKSLDAVAYRPVTGLGSSTGAPLYLSLVGGTAGQPGYLVAPVQLPQGAVITGLELVAIDNDGTSVSPQVLLTATAPGTTGFVNTALAASVALATESVEFQTVAGPAAHTVDNTTFQYQLRVRLNQNSTGTVLFGVHITYTVAEVE